MRVNKKYTINVNIFQYKQVDLVKKNNDYNSHSDTDNDYTGNISYIFHKVKLLFSQLKFD